MLNHMNLKYFYRTFHPESAECTFFSSAYWTFPRIDLMLGHKTSFSKFKKTEIISGIFFWPQQYETRNQLQEENWGKHKHVKTKYLLLKYEWVNEEIKEQMRKYLETNENKNTNFQNLWDAEKAVLREIPAYLKK